MAILDVFNNNAFKMVAMTEAINKVETLPQEISESGVFSTDRIRQEAVSVESREGKLSLVKTSNRGAPVTAKSDSKRKIHKFDTSRIVESFTITSSELAFIRDFGEEQAVKQVQKEITRRLSGDDGILNDIRMTHEHMRLGAMQGVVIDADGSQIYDYFDEFGATKPAEVNFDLENTVGGNLRKMINSKILRPMSKARKGLNVRGVDSWCGSQFFDDLIANDEVRETYLNQQEAGDLRDGYLGRAFNFGGVHWREYMGSDDGSKVAIPANKCKFVPSNGTGALVDVWAPGEAFSHLDTEGQEFYVEVMPEVGREEPRYVTVEVSSYPLMLNKRPEMCFSGSTPAA